MADVLREYHVDVVEKGVRTPRGRVKCVIGEHLMFDTQGIETYCLAAGNPTIYDACVVAAAVQFCDHAMRRPSTGWGRDITLRVPVHARDHWESTEVSNSLHNALSVLTGDRWRIDFVPRKHAFVSKQQQPLVFPSSCVVLPFGNGLDSHLTAGLLERKYGAALIPVRLGSRPLPARRGGASSAHEFAAVPWRVSYGSRRAVETTARSRGFRFTLVSGVAAFLCRSHKVVLPESGQAPWDHRWSRWVKPIRIFGITPCLPTRCGSSCLALFGH